MKTGIHPTSNPVIFVDDAAGQELITTSTMTSRETREIDGLTYYVVHCDVTSFSHPFFTGEMRFVDRQGRVDRFQKQQQTALAKKQAAQAKKTKKSSKPAGPTKSYREILLDQQGAMRKAGKTTEIKKSDKAAIKMN